MSERQTPTRRTAAAGSEPAPPQTDTATDADAIQVSLRSVVLKLPETLKAKAKQPPAGGVRISFPAGKILPQLPQGTVRIPFGDLRKASPPGVFSDASDRDHTLVDLPLQEILQQLKPDQLPRRLRQKRVEVPDEVVPIFTPQRGQSSVRIAKPSTPELARTRPDAPAPRPPARPHSAPAPAPIKPSVPLPMPAALRTPSAAPQPPPIKPSTPLPSLGAANAPTAAPHPAAIAPAPKPSQSSPTDTPTPTPTPAATTGATEYISVPLAAITTGWPEPIRHALAGLNAPDATLQLPAAETEQALKRGKVVFPWKRLKPLVRPPLKTALAPSLDDLQLELPLPAIAPLFMAQRKSAPVQRKYDVGEDIPDVFSNRGLTAAHAPASAPPATAPPKAAPAPAPASRPSAAAPITPAAPLPLPLKSAPPSAPAPASTPPSVPAPALAKAPAPAPSPVAPPPGPAASDPRDIGDVFGQPGRKNWAPAEIAQRTAELPGVAGAVIAMQDGLLIAGNLPAGLNGETIAAFLPQMFTRMMQYSKELKFGETDNITFILDNVPLRIYRTGSVYFAALGRAREPLPELPLRLIASHLGPQSK